tara:strand:+ start:3358 stop:4134 length:777 start_codon:yes stop_codon:yes gene_type:complete
VTSSILIGLIQGVVEWIPVSSEGILVILFDCCTEIGFSEGIAIALLLHFGTGVASTMYFSKDIIEILKVRDWTTGSQKNLLSAIIISSFFTGIIGIPIYLAMTSIPEHLGKYLMILIGILIIITGLVQIRQVSKVGRSIDDIKVFEMSLLGIVQGFSILPGLSRSALTLSFLIGREVKVEDALKLSYLISIPVSFGGGLLGLFALGVFSLELSHIVGIFTAFLAGIITIGFLMRLLKNIPMGMVALATGVLVIGSSFL